MITSFHVIENSSWFFTSKDRIFHISNAAISATVNNEVFSLIGDLVFEDAQAFGRDYDRTVSSKKFETFVSTCRFHFHKEGHFSISVSLENCSSSPIQLGKIEFVSGEGQGELRCKSPEPLKVLWTTGTCCNSSYPVMSFSTPGNRCLSRHFSLIYDCKSKTGLMIGFLSFDRLNTEMVLESNETGLLVSAYSDFNQYMLAPGAAIDSETITFETGLDYHTLLVHWAKRVKLHYNPTFMTEPAIGWIGGWNYRNTFIGEDSYEQIVKENVEVLRKEFFDYPIKYIWVSIGNLEKDVPGNWLKENTKRFPSGLSALSADLQSKGYRLGLWVAPFWIPDQHTDLHEIFSDCLLRYKGKPIHLQHVWRIGETGDNPEERTGFYSLDPTHPKGEAFLKQVFTYYKDMGIRYFMLDFLNAGEGPMSNTFMYDEYFDKSLVNGPQVYSKAVQIIREASANDTYMVASTGPTLINTGYMDATRTGPDFGEGREPSPKYPSFYPAACKTDAWTLFRLAINYYASSYFMDKILFHVDAFNVLNIDPPASISEIQTIVSLFAMSSGPVMLGGDLAHSDMYRKELTKKCLPQAKKGAVPMDLFSPISKQGPSMFLQEYVTDWDQWYVLYVINTGSEVLSCSVSFDSLGLDTSELGVYDFWDQRYLGINKEKLCVHVAPYSTKVLRLFEHKTYPTVISTDMHVSQGAVDLKCVEWDEENCVLSGCAVRGVGETGSLIVSLPTGYLPASYMNNNVARSELHDETVIYKQIRFHSAQEPFEIHFKKERKIISTEGDAGRM